MWMRKFTSQLRSWLGNFGKMVNAGRVGGGMERCWGGKQWTITDYPALLNSEFVIWTTELRKWSDYFLNFLKMEHNQYYSRGTRNNVNTSHTKDTHINSQNIKWERQPQTVRLGSGGLTPLSFCFFIFKMEKMDSTSLTELWLKELVHTRHSVECVVCCRRCSSAGVGYIRYAMTGRQKTTAVVVVVVVGCTAAPSTYWQLITSTATNKTQSPRKEKPN